MNGVCEFLEKNGFEKRFDYVMGENIYIRGRCSVCIRDRYYKVIDKDHDVMYSDDLNIYWLIGVLTYYGYMDKNYKQ